MNDRSRPITEQLGRVVAGRYELVEPLGRGGMGVVWRARDTVLERDVAVKEVQLPPGPSAEEREVLRTRVFREARAAARLSHPSVVTVYDVTEEDGQPFIVMELVDAPSLADVVRRDGALPPARVARVGLDVLSALELAHTAGVVHRDIKPANVMVPSQGHCKLADFGIASVKDDPSVTSTGLVLGSPAYMAPEQGSSGVTSPASDLWSLGATLFFAVEGTPPFEGDGALPTLSAVVNSPPKPMSCAGPLAPLLRWLLSKDPADRPDHAQVRTELEHVAVEPYPVEPAPAETTQVIRMSSVPVAAAPRTYGARRGGGWPVVAGLLGLIALVVVGALAYREVNDRTPDGSAGGNNRPRSTAPSAMAKATARASATASATVSARASAQPTATAAGGVPADWTTYRHGPTGYTISHPPGWRVKESGPNTDIVDPDTGSYLRVAWTDEPGDDPVQRWHEVEDSFRKRYRGYERIRIDPATYQGFEAAEWEFRYTSPRGNRLHALDLGFVTGDYGFALLWQTPDAVWESSKPTFEQFKRAFVAPE